MIKQLLSSFLFSVTYFTAPFFIAIFAPTAQIHPHVVRVLSQRRGDAASVGANPKSTGLRAPHCRHFYSNKKVVQKNSELLFLLLYLRLQRKFTRTSCGFCLSGVGTPLRSVQTRSPQDFVHLTAGICYSENRICINLGEIY